jgi:hypothetical protein
LSDEQLRTLAENARQRAEERARTQARAQAKARSQGAGTYAAEVYRRSVSIHGTLAERYVRDVRFGGHDLPLPQELRFHPAVWSDETKSRHPALVVVCGYNGKLARIQCVLLDPETGKKAAIRAAKLTFGAGAGHVPGSFGPRNTGEPQLQLLVEGPEDAIVLNACTGWRSDASLGTSSLGKPRYPSGTKLVIVGDNGAAGHIAARSAAAIHRANGCDVVVIFPPADAKDANDVLLQRGPDGVRQWIEDGLQPKPIALPAYYPAVVEPREQAKRRQDDIILSFLANAAEIGNARQMLRRMRAAELADKPDATRAQKAAVTRRLHGEVAARFGFGKRIPRPQRVLLTGSQATGKTTVSLQGIAAIEAEIVVHKYAPTLNKCYEDLATYRKIATERSMPAYVVHGRGQNDPQHPDTKMCPRFRMVKRVLEAGLSPRQKICPSCKLRKTCGTMRQEREIAELGNRTLFIMASAYAFLPTPAPEPDIVVADECLTIDAVATAKIKLETLTQQKLAPYHGGDPGPAIEAGCTLDAIRQALTEPEALAALRAADIDQEKLSKLRQLVDVTPDVNINGEMPDDEIKKAVDAVVDYNRKQALTLLSALSHEIDMPRATLSGVVFDPKEEVFRVSILRQPLRTRDAGLLMLDGTGNPGLNRTLFGGNLRHEEVRFERDAHVTGTIGRRYSRQSITGRDADGEEIPSRKVDAERLRQDVGTVMERHLGFLLVAAKAAEEALKDGRHIPLSAETTYFGDLRGKNDWKALLGVLCVGRQSLSIEDLEMTARAYLARDPAPFTSMAGPMPADWPCKQWPYRATRMRRMRDGSLQAVEVDVHPDPRVQEVFEQFREAEAIQAVDRVRPVFNHREVLALNELVLDLTYDKILTHRELVQGGGRIERILERTGVVPESKDELVRVFPDVFTSSSTALRDIQAWLEKRVQNPKSTTLWKMDPFSYRRPGQRGRPCRVWISGQHQDVRAAAEAVLGPLSAFEPVVEAGAPPDVSDIPAPVPEPAPEPVPDVAPEPVRSEPAQQAPPPAPEPVPEPVLPVSPVPPPVLGRLVIKQADCIMQPPIKPQPAPVPPWQALRTQQQSSPSPMPAAPADCGDVGTAEFWDEHPFFQWPDWMHMTRTIQKPNNDE